MPRRRRHLAMIGFALVLVAIAVGGCGSSGERAAVRSPTAFTSQTSGPTTPAPSIPVPRTTEAGLQDQALREARRTLAAYLDTWRDRGLAIAARRYVDPAYRPGSDQGLPRLLTGTVGRAEITAWESLDRFTFSVELDLHFDGDPAAWNEGENTRFVTAARQAGSGTYLLGFATSP